MNDFIQILPENREIKRWWPGVHSVLQVIVVLAFLAELALLTGARNYFGPHISPVLLALSSIIVGICLVLKSLSQRKAENPISNQRANKLLQLFIQLFITVAGVTIIISFLQPVFEKFPIDFYRISYSDIIPQVGILVERFLAGEQPYQIIDIWGYALFPTYLPMQWLPFVIPELMDSDYRWMAFIVLLGAVLFYQIRIFLSSLSLFRIILLSLIPFITWISLIHYDEVICGVTIEPLIAGYYLLLGMAILGRNNFLIAAAIVCCLLSRYAIIFWVPLYFLVQYFENRHAFERQIIFLGIGVLTIYVLPFLLQDPSIFLKGYQYHTQAAANEWQPAWQAEGENPYHLFRGIGLAVYFYDFVEGSIPQRIDVLRFIHLMTSLLCIIVLALIYLKKRMKIRYDLYLLASLKIYFCFFYSFIQIPYSYLFIVPLFISIAVVYKTLDGP